MSLTPGQLEGADHDLEDLLEGNQAEASLLALGGKRGRIGPNTISGYEREENSGDSYLPLCAHSSGYTQPHRNAVSRVGRGLSMRREGWGGHEGSGK